MKKIALLFLYLFASWFALAIIFIVPVLFSLITGTPILSGPVVFIMMILIGFLCAYVASQIIVHVIKYNEKDARFVRIACLILSLIFSLNPIGFLMGLSFLALGFLTGTFLFFKSKIK